MVRKDKIGLSLLTGGFVAAGGGRRSRHSRPRRIDLLGILGVTSRGLNQYIGRPGSGWMDLSSILWLYH
jgi:hypothetical protein